MTDAALYREQKAPFHLFSQRWKTMDLVDITDWASDEVRKISISQTFLTAPYEVRVRKFVSHPGDMLAEKWVNDGNIKTFPIPPYGMVDMVEAACSVGAMIEREVANYINKTICPNTGDGLVWETYVAAFRWANQAPVRLRLLVISGPAESILTSFKTTREQTILCDAFRLWVSCRLASQPDQIVGEDKLGMKTVDDPSSPYQDLVPTPPVLGAQLECILYSRFLRPLARRVLRELLALMETRQPCYWYTIYLVLFLMLHNCSMMTRRDMEYAAQVSLGVSLDRKDTACCQEFSSVDVMIDRILQPREH